MDPDRCPWCDARRDSPAAYCDGCNHDPDARADDTAADEYVSVAARSPSPLDHILGMACSIAFGVLLAGWWLVDAHDADRAIIAAKAGLSARVEAAWSR